MVLVGLIGCKGYENVGADGYATPKGFYSTLNAEPVYACSEGMSLRPKEKSIVKWEVARLKGDEAAPFAGSNMVGGQWDIAGNSISTSKAVLYFDISSTFSDNALRDERIHEVVFGKHKGQIMRFTLDSIKEPDLVMEEGSTAEFTVVGRLELAGQVANIEIPVTAKSLPGSVTLQSTKLFRLNMRSLSPTVNGINLVDQLTQILSYVPGIAVKDEVILDFNIEMENFCNK